MKYIKVYPNINLDIGDRIKWERNGKHGTNIIIGFITDNTEHSIFNVMELDNGEKFLISYTGNSNSVIKSIKEIKPPWKLI